jgi:hypothetical protein
MDNRGRGQRNNINGPSQPSDGFVEHVVKINRVSKKTKGGNKVGFSALVVVVPVVINYAKVLAITELNNSSII